jgi:hypothetical protein
MSNREHVAEIVPPLFHAMQYWVGKQEAAGVVPPQGTGWVLQALVAAALGEAWAATAAHPSSYSLPSQPQVGF